MKRIMTAGIVVMAACAFSLTAFGGAACCGSSAKAEAKAAGNAKMECKVDAKASCIPCEGCKKSGTVCEKCTAKCQILSIKDGKATCCGCEKGCKNCTLKEGEAQCSCGKMIKSCELKGKFVCTPCKTIADKTGKCSCGAALQEVK